MREQPWHKRQASAGHFETYKNLMDIHAMTVDWLRELKIERPSHSLSPAVGDQVKSQIQGIEHAVNVAFRAQENIGLDDLLDDTDPSDLLLRLKQGIFTLQAWTLRSCNLADELTLLEQSSWRAGRECAQKRWPSHQDRQKSTQSETIFGLAALFQSSPIGDSREAPPFLNLRMTETEAILEWLRCPHQSELIEVKLVSDPLCRLQSHWIRGFLYQLNSRLKMDYYPAKAAESDTGHCRLHWHLA